MIHAIRANQPTFRTVRLEPGFNVVLADRTREATRKDSRNGLGKTSLLEVIHFCLGSSSRDNPLIVDSLVGWEFTVEMTLAGHRVSVSRNTSSANVIYLSGAPEAWLCTAQEQGGRWSLPLKGWTSLLGKLVFGLPAETRKYCPSFRGLFPYFARRGRDAFSTPFEHFRKQKEVDKQVANAFLLGLEWEDAREYQLLKDRKRTVDAMKRAAQAGLVEDLLGSKGELEAEKVRLSSQLAEQQDQLATWKVHDQYRQIEEQVNDLTAQIHAASNANVRARRMQQVYSESLAVEEAPDAVRLLALYEEAGVSLPGAVKRRLDEVEGFHEAIVSNRRVFLEEELLRLERGIQEREGQIKVTSDERARLVKILNENHALDEYTRLQERHGRAVSRLRDIEARIARLEEFEDAQGKLRIAQEELHQRARRDYQARRPQRERAITLFNGNSEALYDAPGNLVIDVVEKTGFRFSVDIQRAGSQGVDLMKVFCYDLTLAQLWAYKQPSPGLLIHDSTIFDGVDERQISLALERAAAKSDELKFQYLCTLNSDTTPWSEFSEGFDLGSFVRLTLTDDTESGSLFGIRF